MAPDSCQISVSPSFFKWNDFLLLLYLWINVADFNSDHLFYIQFKKWQTNWSFTDCQMPHFMIVLTLYINILNISWIKKKADKNVYFF